MDTISAPSIHQIQLRHVDYTVGWICTLQCELVAAKAMFDDIHEALSNPPGDENIYSLGSISGHNVVVAVLPLGRYGTTSATAVAIRMLSTFRSICIPLLVGTGGGVPVTDIRLGDVVVGIPNAGRDAVVQYDYGKTLSLGHVHMTGHLNKPASQLLIAISHIKIRHEMESSLMPIIIEQARQSKSNLIADCLYPGADRDILYDDRCQHSSHLHECKICQPREVRRIPRSSTAPVVHYGTIASGNQVIKNSTARDRLASSIGNLCFEMEAAGVMDYYPALVIRGISDYCDNYKTKNFQAYAALTAAAFAKELLGIIPQTSGDSLFENNIKYSSEAVVAELDFTESRTRLLTIKNAHPKTLTWILTHDTYCTWLDNSRFDQHYGFLWIKGKPGSGKSTLMRFLLSETRSHGLTISFFFVARGTNLQKTVEGMYRSLLCQLIQHIPDLQHSLELTTLANQVQDVEILRALFNKSIAYIRQPVFCFIDALDESGEQDIRNLLSDLERIMESKSSSHFFRVCCASRYYPHISIRIGLGFYLDKEPQHEADIANYVDAKLQIGKGGLAKKICSEMVRKAAGIFLWAVFVVQILQKESDGGRMHRLRAKLQETPSDINELIQDILLRDNDNLEDLISTIQWILYASSPMQVPQFYYAVLIMDKTSTLSPTDIDDVCLEDMKRYITSSSKGLIETTDHDWPPKVQLIHESVREFLLDYPLVELWPGFSEITESVSQARISLCCARFFHYKGRSILDELQKPGCISNRKLSSWPQRNFLTYVKDNLLYHAGRAEELGIAQTEVMNLISSEEGAAAFHNTMKYGTDLHQKLIEEKHHLLRSRFVLTRRYDSIPPQSRNESIMQHMKNGEHFVVTHLLRPAPADTIDTDEFIQTVKVQCQNVTSLDHSEFTAWYQLLGNGSNRIGSNLAEMLLRSKEWVKLQDELTLAHLTAIVVNHRMKDREDILITDCNSTEEIEDSAFERLLYWASYDGDLQAVNYLLDRMTNTGKTKINGELPLHAAARKNRGEVLRRIINKVADRDATDYRAATPLSKMMKMSMMEVMMVMMVDYGYHDDI